ncbi:MAG: tautomerase family protein [Rhodospirillaceae bacterium]|nr:tautomerase family protein [Rhodospirillaceae bacterium]
MPVIYVYGFERPIEKKREIAKGITEATCEAYDVPPETVVVYIFDVPKENAAHGGVLVPDSE